MEGSKVMPQSVTQEPAAQATAVAIIYAVLRGIESGIKALKRKSGGHTSIPYTVEDRDRGIRIEEVVGDMSKTMKTYLIPEVSSQGNRLTAVETELSITRGD